MSLSKNKCWYSSNCKHAVPLITLIMTLSITALIKITFSKTNWILSLSINYSQHNDTRCKNWGIIMLGIVVLNDCMLNVIVLNGVTLCHCTEWSYAVSLCWATCDVRMNVVAPQLEMDWTQSLKNDATLKNDVKNDVFVDSFVVLGGAQRLSLNDVKKSSK